MLLHTRRAGFYCINFSRSVKIITLKGINKINYAVEFNGKLLKGLQEYVKNDKTPLLDVLAPVWLAESIAILCPFSDFN